MFTLAFFSSIYVNDFFFVRKLNKIWILWWTVSNLFKLHKGNNEQENKYEERESVMEVKEDNQ